MIKQNIARKGISKQGFTLIELLIVISIIGILAAALLVSLGGARQSGRDARRIADLRNIQSVLELYFNKTGEYPGVDMAGLGTELKNKLGAATRISKDPSPGKDYRYTYYSNKQRYILGADLEAEDSQTSKESLPNSVCPTSGGGDPCKCYDANVIVNKASYCVGL